MALSQDVSFLRGWLEQLIRDTDVPGMAFDTDLQEAKFGGWIFHGMLTISVMGAGETRAFMASHEYVDFAYRANNVMPKKPAEVLWFIINQTRESLEDKNPEDFL